MLWASAALLSPCIPLALYFAGNWYSFFHSYSLGMALGIFSYGYFLIALILSARLPFLDRRFGHDRVMVFHGYCAFLGLVLAAGHVTFKMIFSRELSAQVWLGIAALSVFTSVITVTLLFMVGSILHRIPLLARLKSRIARTRAGDYSRLKFFHNSVSIASLLAALHVFFASSTRESPARMSVMGGWGGIALLAYGYHKIIRVLLMRRAAWRIARTTGPAPGIVELHMRRETGHPWKHRAGQFAYFRVLSGRCGFEEHPFTISSPPDSPELTVTVKRLGDYTARLREVPPGTPVLVDGPYGMFTPRRSERPLLFIAGGIGITPFMSVLREWESHDPPGARGTVTLVWSCGSGAEMVHRDFFEGYEKKEPRFTFVPVVTRSGNTEGRTRRIDARLLEPLLEPSRRPSTAVFICGPPGLRRASILILKTMGIPAANILYEKFEL